MSSAAYDNFLAENWKYLLGALALHAAIGISLTATMNATATRVAPAHLAIKATLVDHSAQRAKREREEAARRAREQAEAEERAKVEAAERQKAEEAAAELKRQDERRAEEQRQVEQKRQAEAKAAADKKAATTKKATDERKRVADIKAKQEEKLKSERETREQSAREEELRRQLADEEGRMQAENSGMLNQYVALIQQRVIRNWNKPTSARAGIQCDVKVTQAPGGTVLSVQVDKCNGDAAVRQSIQAAVYRASPLPPPPDARLFQRVILFQFKPSE
jgi:colicin import membrane protein